jgi:hypothetical protein
LGNGLVQVMEVAPGVPVPTKPNAVDALASREPFHATLRAVAVDPLVVSAPFQIWLTAWPLPRVQRTVQPLTGDEPAWTVISPWKPPDQELTVR